MRAGQQSDRDDRYFNHEISLNKMQMYAKLFLTEDIIFSNKTVQVNRVKIEFFQASIIYFSKQNASVCEVICYNRFSILIQRQNSFSKPSQD